MKNQWMVQAAFGLSIAFSLPILTVQAASEQQQEKEEKVFEQSFTAAKKGEALLDLTAMAPGTDWGQSGSESAVITVTVDGKYNQDLVLFMGKQKFSYQVALGPVSAGKHTIQIAFNRDKSPAGAKGAKVLTAKTKVVSDDEEAALVYKYSPILYGRDLPEIAGTYENGSTDVPLQMYHTKSRDANGNLTIEYSVIWSNEDGGTNSPALMARWGRTTDIEWIYQVTLDPQGRVLSEKYQAPNHVTLDFTGAKQGNHPLMYTSTSNNMVSPVINPALSTGYRFFMDPAWILPKNRAREVMMDQNPWMYEIMGKEMNREGRLETANDPATQEVSDQRNYLYIEVDKDTLPENTNSNAWMGTAIAVKLKGDPTWYTSNHSVPSWSIQRDIPAATTVELPAGTSERDVEAIQAMAVPVDSNSTDSVTPAKDFTITVTAINRAFFLGKNYQPEKSFISWKGAVALTPDQPTAILWKNGKKKK